MPKVISEGIVEIDGQKVNLKDFDDTRGAKEKGFYTHGKISLKNYCHIKSPLQKTLF